MSKEVLILFLAMFAAAQSCIAQSSSKLCSKQVQEFTLGPAGKINITGRTYEAPVCIQMDYNPLHFSIDFSTAITYTNGPDVSTVFTTGGSNTAAAPKVNVARNKPPQLLQAPIPASLPEAFNQIESSYQVLHSSLHQLDTKYGQHLDCIWLV